MPKRGDGLRLGYVTFSEAVAKMRRQRGELAALGRSSQGSSLSSCWLFSSSWPLPAWHVRFASKADKQQTASVCPLCAISRHMQCSKEYRYSMKLRPNPSERVTLASPARLPSDLHVIMHPQIVETDRQLTRRYVASVPRCWAMWIGLIESRSAGGTDQAAGC